MYYIAIRKIKTKNKVSVVISASIPPRVFCSQLRAKLWENRDKVLFFGWELVRDTDASMQLRIRTHVYQGQMETIGRCIHSSVLYQVNNIELIRLNVRTCACWAGILNKASQLIDVDKRLVCRTTILLLKFVLKQSIYSQFTRNDEVRTLE